MLKRSLVEYDCSLDSNSPPLVRDVLNMFDSVASSDFKIIVDDKEIRLHRFMLIGEYSKIRNII